MYVQLTAETFRKKYNLSDDYAVDGILAVGTWTAYAPINLDHLKSVLNEIGDEYECRQFVDPHLHEVFEIKIEGKIIWYFAVMGTSVMSEYLHKGSMLGSKKNILIGSVGGLSVACQPGDIISSIESKGNGNARYYQRNNIDDLYKPDRALADSLKSRLPENFTVHTGKTTTCEILMAETQEDIDEWSQQGYLGVEMEAALVFSLSSHFDIPAAALLNIGDNLVNNVTFFDDEHSSNIEVFESSRRASIKVAVEEILAS